MIIAIIIICLLFILTGIEICRETHTFRVTRYTIGTSKLDGLQGKKILFLSDLHNQIYGAENKELLEAVQRESPDLILAGGDMLVGKKNSSYRPALQFVQKLPGVCPVFCANGNHEQRMKEKPYDYEAAYAKYKQELEASGVHFLENAFADYDHDGLKVRIYGLEIPRRCYEHTGRWNLTQKEIEERIGRCDRTRFNILLAHNPDFVRAYKEWGADLILCGHFHGGIIRLPGLAGVISPNLKLFPRYSGGLYQEEDASVVVSRGLGNHTVKIRLFNPAEIIALALAGKKPEKKNHAQQDLG